MIEKEVGPVWSMDEITGMHPFSWTRKAGLIIGALNEGPGLTRTLTGKD